MGDSCDCDKMESLSEFSLDVDAVHFSIDDTGMGILLMVPLAVALSC